MGCTRLGAENGSDRGKWGTPPHWAAAPSVEYESQGCEWTRLAKAAAPIGMNVGWDWGLVRLS